MHRRDGQRSRKEAKGLVFGGSSRAQTARCKKKKSSSRGGDKNLFQGHGACWPRGGGLLTMS